MFKKSILSIASTLFLFNCAPTVEKTPTYKHTVESSTQEVKVGEASPQYADDKCAGEYSLSNETKSEVRALIVQANLANEAGNEAEAQNLLQAASDLSVQGALDFQDDCGGIQLSEAMAPMGVLGSVMLGSNFFLKTAAAIAASFSIGAIDLVASHSIAAIQGICITANIVVLGETNCFPTEEPVGGDDDMGTGSDDDDVPGDDTSALLATIDSLNATIVSLNATIESLEEKIKDLEEGSN